MTAKLITFDGEARHALERGLGQVARAVKITLGPKGRNVVLHKNWDAPTITNDGGPSRPRSSWRTRRRTSGPSPSRRSPRGPTTWRATARPRPPSLAQAMVKQGLRSVTAGANPMALKRGIEAAGRDASRRRLVPRVEPPWTGECVACLHGSHI
jgi:chaperonin GroEL